MPNYTYSNHPDSAVKNKYGVTSHDELEEIEAERVAARTLEFESGYGPTRSFDAAHLKAIHKYLFQDVYEWAGHTRGERVRLSDGTTATEPFLSKVDGRPFMDGPLIPDALERMGDRLRQANFLQGLAREEFADRAADLLVELNSIHPFREGNGRTQRAFLEELAKEAGHQLDFSVVTRERMLQASIAGHASIAGQDISDASVMRRMLREISDPVRVAALGKAIDTFDRLGFPWNDHYLATAEPGHSVVVTMAGVAGDQFMARTATEILIGREADLPTPRPGRGEVFTFEPSHWASRATIDKQGVGAVRQAAMAPETHRDTLRRELQEKEDWQLDFVIKEAHVVDRSGAHPRPMTVTDAARLVAPAYAEIADEAAELRGEADQVTKTVEHYARLQSHHRNQGDERWSAMGALRQAGHQTGVRLDDEMVQHEQGERLAAEKLAPAEKRRDELLKELPAVEAAEAKALEKAWPAAEQKLAELRERADLAREVLTERAQEQAGRDRTNENQSDITDENDRGLER